MADQRAVLMRPGVRGLSIMPELGSPEHYLLLLVLAEVALLVIVRRVFSAAHGG
jgi:hypothetical protein